MKYTDDSFNATTIGKVAINSNGHLSYTEVK